MTLLAIVGGGGGAGVAAAGAPEFFFLDELPIALSLLGLGRVDLRGLPDGAAALHEAQPVADLTVLGEVPLDALIVGGDDAIGFAGLGHATHFWRQWRGVDG